MSDENDADQADLVIDRCMIPAIVGSRTGEECCSRAPTAQSFTMRTYLDWQNEGVRRVDDLRIEHVIPELARL